MKINCRKKINSIKQDFMCGASAVFILLKSTYVFSTDQNNVIKSGYEFEKSQMVYTPEEMFNFSIEQYLVQNAPHLVDYTEVISHWSGYSSISPKVIIALIEYQTGLITNEYLDVSIHYKPMGSLSEKYGFSEQVEDVSIRLAKYFYKIDEKNKVSKQSSLSKLFNSHQQNYQDTAGDLDVEILDIENLGIKSLDTQGFYDTYYQLFPDELVNNENFSDELTKNEFSSLNSKYVIALPPDNLLQLPYLIGKSWRYAGTHTNTGSGSFPQSSLDLNNGGSWGSNTSNIWIAAAAPGKAKRHSSCNLEIIHPGGWSTTYYHLDNIQVSTNQTVERNQKVANYANNKSQALCQGGHSTGPHQHFSLKKDGKYQHLNNVKLSGFKVHTGRNSYDSDCRYFWLEKNNVKKCAWTKLTNPGVPGGPDPKPDDNVLKNGVPVTGLSANKGNQVHYKIEVPTGAKNLKIKIDGGSGDADMYVKYGSKPTLSSWHCRPYRVTQLEECNYSTPKVTTYYVMLHAFNNYRDISLVASYNK